MYNPNAGIQEQVDQAQRIVDGVLNALQQDLAFTEAQHIEQMLELRRQVERSRGLYQEELQALKKAIADQEKQTQSQVDFLETAKTKCTEAVQERKAAALKTTYRPQSPAEEDGEEVMASPRDGAAGALPAQSSATGSTPTSNNSQPSFASAPAPAPASTPAAPAAPASAAPGPEDDKASVKSDASSGTASSTSTPTPTTSRVQSTPGTKSKPTGLSRPGSMVRPSTTPRTRTTKTMPVTTPRKVGAAVKS
uniref:Uncharacterized protein n=1 Tax=Eutreptiella gymnastica TaxID=73025 RepID=A0A7S4GCY3_9EUGL